MKQYLLAHSPHCGFISAVYEEIDVTLDVVQEIHIFLCYLVAVGVPVRMLLYSCLTIYVVTAKAYSKVA